MCNRYRPAHRIRVHDLFGFTDIEGAWPESIGPMQPGPYVLADRLVVGQWSMIPPGSKTRKPTRSDGSRLSTNNCRRETVATAWTYRGPWSRGQRCLIPAEDFGEPYWGTGSNIWWRFARADGEPWALAGIWSEWTDPGTGELVPNYSMLTQNCDAHRLLRLMHKPDPKLPPDRQDKRAVVPIERADWDQWLNGSVEQADQLIRLPPLEIIQHDAVDPEKAVPLEIY